MAILLADAEDLALQLGDYLDKPEIESGRRLNPAGCSPLRISGSVGGELVVQRFVNDVGDESSGEITREVGR